MMAAIGSYVLVTPNGSSVNSTFSNKSGILDGGLASGGATNDPVGSFIIYNFPSRRPNPAIHPARWAISAFRFPHLLSVQPFNVFTSFVPHFLLLALPAHHSPLITIQPRFRFPDLPLSAFSKKLFPWTANVQTPPRTLADMKMISSGRFGAPTTSNPVAARSSPPAGWGRPVPTPRLKPWRSAIGY